MEIKEVLCKAGLTMPHIRIFTVILFIVVNVVLAKDTLLVVRQDGKDFEDALKGLIEELKSDFTIKDKVITRKSEVDEIKLEIDATNPKLVVLMDNTSITLFKKYQSALKDGETVLPSLSIMGVFIADAIKEIKNATGISYEIPIVTSVVSLRSVLDVPVKKVGVIHREFLDRFLTQNKKFCMMEGIEIVEVTLPNKSSEYKKLLKKGLKTLFEEHNVDVLWVPNDNAFLKPDIIQNVWVPTVRKKKKPVIVGVEILVSPQLDFGTYAVLPDHVFLGSQAAGKIYDIMENDWQCENEKVDPPISVYKIINFRQAKKNFNATEQKLKVVDKILK